MPRLLLGIVVLSAVFISASLTAVAEKNTATMDAIYVPVGELALAPPVGVISQRSAVAFPHSRHFGYTCRTCHHKWDGESQVQGCTVSECHDQQSAPVKSKKFLDYGPDSIRYFKYAFHKQCIGCHREIQIRNAKLVKSRRTLKEPLQKNGPTGCVGCHPRK